MKCWSVLWKETVHTANLRMQNVSITYEQMTNRSIKMIIDFFSFSIAVSSLIANPPDSGTLCGHPVKYTIAENIEVPDPRPHVLVVRGLPTEFPGVQQALAVYFKNTTKTHPLSCEVHEDIATVKFKDEQRM